MSDYRIETKCVQAGYTPGNGEPRQIPIIQSTTFKYATSEDMGKLFDLEASGYFYSRLQNPTCDHVAAKIAALEGGSAAMLTGSGLCNQTCFSHLLCKKRLTKHIIDFMCTSMIQVFTFQINLRPAQIFCHLLCKIKS